MTKLNIISLKMKLSIIKDLKLLLLKMTQLFTQHYTIYKDNKTLKTTFDDQSSPNKGNNIIGNSGYESDNIVKLLKGRQNDDGPGDIFVELLSEENYSENDNMSEENMPENYDQIENWKNLGEKPFKKLKRPTKYKGKSPEIERRLN